MSFRERLSEDDGRWTLETKKELLAEYDKNMRELEELKKQFKDMMESKSTSEPTTSAGANKISPRIEISGKEVHYERRPNGYKLDSNTPSYSGRDNESFEKWRYVMANAMATAGIPEELEFYVLAPYLKGSALDTYVEYQKGQAMVKKKPEMIEFMGLLENSEANIARKEGIKTKLRHLRQMGSFEDYLHRFKELAIESGMREEDLKPFFIDGLKEKARWEVWSKNPDRLNDAYALARRYFISARTDDNEQIYKANFVKSKYKGKPYDNNRRVQIVDQDKRKIICRKCNKPGHISTECRSGNITCFKCKKQGHYASKCDSRYRSSNGQQHQQSKSYSSGEKTRAFKSNTIVSCPIRSNEIEKKDDNLLVVETIIDQKHEVEAMCDSGSARSIMKKKLAENLNIEVTESKAKLEFGNTSTEQVQGITKPIRVQIGQIDVNMSFFVVNNLPFDIILGAEFFIKSRTVPNLITKTLDSIDKRIISIKDNEEHEGLITMTIKDDVEIESKISDEIELSWKAVDPSIIKADCNFNRHQAARFEAIKSKIIKNTANNFLDLKGGARVSKFKIKLKEDKVVFKYPYRRSEIERVKLKKFADELFQAGLIRHSTSPFCSPYFLIERNGKKRGIIDFRELNKITEKEDWPLPDVESCLFRLRKGQIFSRMDAKHGFFQVPVEESSKKFTAFSDGERKFEWNFMPMGIMNAPIVFTRIMSELLGDLDFVVIYMDDICIFSNTIENHFHHLEIVLDRLSRHNVKINLEKCAWFAKRVYLFGYVVSSKGIEIDESKVTALTSRKPPNTVKELQSFIGFCNYYRKFVKDFSEIAGPLYSLLKSDKEWNWTPECQESFDKLIRHLTSSPILRQPDFSRTFIVNDDASNEAMGAVLDQEDNDKRE